MPGAKNLGKREQGSPGQETSSALLTSPSPRQLSAARGPHAGRLVGAGLRGPRVSFLCSTSLEIQTARKSPARAVPSEARESFPRRSLSDSQLLPESEVEGFELIPQLCLHLAFVLSHPAHVWYPWALGWWEATFFILSLLGSINPMMWLINPLWGHSVGRSGMQKGHGSLYLRVRRS